MNRTVTFGPSSTLVIFYAMFTDHYQTPLLSIRWERLAFFLCFVPLLAFVSCVLIALVWHFDETTGTQCNVSNSNSLFMPDCKLFFFFARKCLTLFTRIFWQNKHQKRQKAWKNCRKNTTFRLAIWNETELHTERTSLERKIKKKMTTRSRSESSSKR